MKEYNIKKPYLVCSIALLMGAGFLTHVQEVYGDALKIVSQNTSSSDIGLTPGAQLPIVNQTVSNSDTGVVSGAINSNITESNVVLGGGGAQNSNIISSEAVVGGSGGNSNIISSASSSSSATTSSSASGSSMIFNTQPAVSGNGWSNGTSNPASSSPTPILTISVLSPSLTLTIPSGSYLLNGQTVQNSTVSFSGDSSVKVSNGSSPFIQVINKTTGQTVFPGIFDGPQGSWTAFSLSVGTYIFTYSYPGAADVTQTVTVLANNSSVAGSTASSSSSVTPSSSVSSSSLPGPSVLFPGLSSSASSSGYAVSNEGSSSNGHWIYDYPNSQLISNATSSTASSPSSVTPSSSVSSATIGSSVYPPGIFEPAPTSSSSNSTSSSSMPDSLGLLQNGARNSTVSPSGQSSINNNSSNGGSSLSSQKTLSGINGGHENNSDLPAQKVSRLPDTGDSTTDSLLVQVGITLEMIMAISIALGKKQGKVRKLEGKIYFR